MEKIPFEQLVKGCVYKLHARNLDFAVFDGRAFLGIREKFGSRYLAQEYYADGRMFGTAIPKEVVGQVPEGIPLTKDDEEFGTRDEKTGRPVAFDKPVDEGGKGWYFVDTGEASKDIWPCSRENQKLFDFLDRFEEEHNA